MSIKCMSWAWDQSLRAADKLVLLALADHSNDTGFCWPGSKGVAEKCGISRKTFFKTLTALKDADLLCIAPRHDNEGRQLSNSYFLHNSTQGCEHGVTGEGVTWVTGGVQPGCHEPSIEPSERNTSSGPSEDLQSSSLPTEEAPSSKKPKRKTEITQAFRLEMEHKYADDLGGFSLVYDEIEKAIAHKGYAKYDGKQRYVEDWLKRAVSYKSSARDVALEQLENSPFKNY